MISFLEHSVDISRLLDPRVRRKLFAVGSLQMRAHIICSEPQVDLEILVAKDFLFLSENRVREIRMK